MTDTSKDEHRVFRTKEEIAVDKALSQFAERVEKIHAQCCPERCEYGEGSKCRECDELHALKKEVGIE